MIRISSVRPAPRPPESRVFDRRGARAKARQPPLCSFYLAVVHHKTYNIKNQRVRHKTYNIKNQKQCANG